MILSKIAIALAATTAVAGATGYTTVVLSRNTIENFLVSLDAINKQQWSTTSESTKTNESDDDSESDLSMPYSKFVSTLAGEDDRQKFVEMVGSFGFESESEWAATGDKLVRVLVFTENTDEYVGLVNEISQNIEMLRGNDTLSLAERESAIKRLETQLQRAHAMEPTQADLFLMKPFIARFEKALEAEVSYDK